jgi:hypothetical protein
MDPDDFDRSWQAIAPGLLMVTAAAQLAAAQAAVAYVPALLQETGQPDTPEAAVQPRAFAGVAADGRSLAGLLVGAVVRSKVAARNRVECSRSTTSAAADGDHPGVRAGQAAGAGARRGRSLAGRPAADHGH